MCFFGQEEHVALQMLLDCNDDKIPGHGDWSLWDQIGNYERHLEDMSKGFPYHAMLSVMFSNFPQVWDIHCSIILLSSDVIWQKCTDLHEQIATEKEKKKFELIQQNSKVLIQTYSCTESTVKENK